MAAFVRRLQATYAGLPLYRLQFPRYVIATPPVPGDSLFPADGLYPSNTLYPRG